MDGRILGHVAAHYVAYNGRHLVALVIGLDESKADLVVFTNMKNVNSVKNFGMQFHQDVAFSETKEPGTWHWIECSVTPETVATA